MRDLIVAGTDSIPAVKADWASGLLEMTGDSYPENAFELYQPVIDWIEAYLGADQRPLNLRLTLLYLNTSSIRALIDILDLLETAHQGGRAVGVVWLYEPDNEGVAALAEEFREDYTFPFEVVAQDR